MGWRTLFLLCLLAPLSDVAIVELSPATVQAFDEYVRTAETRIIQQAGSPQFLWSDGIRDGRKKLARGEVLAEPRVGEGDIGVADGLIHDWIGAVFVPGVTLETVLRGVEDYDRAKVTYKPEVLDSKLLSHNGNDFHVYMRLVKSKAGVTAVLNTEHEVHYEQVSDTRWVSRSRTTRIAELVNPGRANERERSIGKDHGFLWRLNSYWRFEQRDGGVYLECEAISLSRSMPAGLGWLINPIIRSLPKDSLSHTLRCARDSFQK